MQQIIGSADEGGHVLLRRSERQCPFKAPPIMLGAPALLKERNEERHEGGVRQGVGCRTLANYQFRLCSVLMDSEFIIVNYIYNH